MNIISAANPQWTNAEHTAVNLTVNIEGIGLIPFTAAQNDVEPHGVALFAAAVAGDFGAVADHVLPSLDDLKAVKIAEINAARLAANRGTFTFQTKPISCDELSRSDIDGANGIISLTGALPVSWLGAWKTATNEYIPIPDVATWAALYGAMVAQGTANFSKAQTLKAQVEAAYQAGDRVALEAVAW